MSPTLETDGQLIGGLAREMALQFHVKAGTANAEPKAVEVLYGSPGHDTTLSASMAFAA